MLGSLRYDLRCRVLKAIEEKFKGRVMVKTPRASWGMDTGAPLVGTGERARVSHVMAATTRSLYLRRSMPPWRCLRHPSAQGRPPTQLSTTRWCPGSQARTIPTSRRLIASTSSSASVSSQLDG